MKIRSKRRPTRHAPPPGGGDVWEVRAVRLPVFVDEGSGPFRPVGAIAVSRATGLLGSQASLAEDGPGYDQALEALLQLAVLTGGRPSRIEVDSPGLAAAVAAHPGWGDVHVAERERLPMVDEAFELLASHMAEGDRLPALDAHPGMTPELLAELAAAAAEFAAAAPWRLLENHDYLQVTTPVPEDAQFVCVMGAGGEERGVLLASSTAVFEHLADAGDVSGDHVLWSLSLDPPHEVPTADLILWERLGLQTAEDGTMPHVFVVGPAGRLARPSASMVQFLATLLRALARTDNRDVVRGQWSHSVPTPGGAADVGLRWVGPEWAPTDIAAADDGPALRQDERLASIALLLDGDRGRALVETASAELPDSVALGLARGMLLRDPDERVAALERCVELTSRELEPAAGDARHVPVPALSGYAQASLHLGVELGMSGRVDEALARCRELQERGVAEADELELDLLITDGRHQVALARLESVPDEWRLAPWCYRRALLAFAAEGGSTEALWWLRRATSANPHVSDLLLERRELPDELPRDLSLGSFGEAALYVARGGWAWYRVDGARRWIEVHFGARRHRTR